MARPPKFNYVQEGFSIGQARLPNILDQRRLRSVNTLINYFVNKGGSVRRRPGTIIEHRFSHTDFLDAEGNVKIEQIFRFGPEGHYLYRTSDYKIGITGPQAKPKFDLTPLRFQKMRWSFNGSAFSLLGAENLKLTIRGGARLGNLLNPTGVVSPIIEIAKTKGGYFLLPKEGMPFKIRYLAEDKVIDISPYYWKNPNNYDDLIRGFPIDPDPQNFPDTLFSGGAVDILTPVRLFIGKNNDIDKHYCEAWLGSDGYTGQIDKAKMALKDFIGKPLYFNVLPTNPQTVLNSYETVAVKGTEDAGRTPVTQGIFLERAYDQDSDFDGPLLTNLNREASISSFNYSSVGGTGVVGRREDVIKSCLYDRRYCLIPYELIEDDNVVSDLTSERVSYSGAVLSQGSAQPAVTKIPIREVADLSVDRDRQQPEKSVRSWSLEGRSAVNTIEGGQSSENFVVPLGVNTYRTQYNKESEDGDLEVLEDILQTRNIEGLLGGFTYDVYNSGIALGKIIDFPYLFITETVNFPGNTPERVRRTGGPVEDSNGVSVNFLKNLWVNAIFAEIQSEKGVEDPLLFSIFSLESLQLVGNFKNMTENSVVTLQLSGNVTPPFRGSLPRGLTINKNFSVNLNINPRFLRKLNDDGDWRMLYFVQDIKGFHTVLVQKSEFDLNHEGDMLLDNSTRSIRDKFLGGRRALSSRYNLNLNLKIIIDGVPYTASLGDSSLTYRGFLDGNNSVGLGYPSLVGGKLYLSDGGSPAVGEDNYKLQTSESDWTSLFSGVLIGDGTSGNDAFILVAKTDFNDLQNITGVQIGGRDYTDRSIGTTPNEAGKTVIFQVPSSLGLKEKAANGTRINFNLLGTGGVVTLRVSTEDVVVARGFNKRSNAPFYYGNNKNFGVLLNQSGNLEDDITGDINALGVHEIEDSSNNKKWTYFLQAKGTLADSTAIKLKINGGAPITLTKQANTDNEYIETTLRSSKPPISSGDQIEIEKSDTTAYQFAGAITPAKRGKYRARCVLFELGYPSPMGVGTPKRRVIGGNDFEDKEAVVNTVYSTPKLQFGSIASIENDFVLSENEGDKIYLVSEEGKANNYFSNLLNDSSGLSDEVKNLFFSSGYLPRGFTAPSALRKYLNDNSQSGEIFEGLFKSAQAKTLENYLNKETEVLPVFLQQLSDVEGADIKITRLTPGFSGKSFFITTNLGVYLSNALGVSSLLARLGVKNNSRILTFRDKFVYLTTSDLVSVNTGSEERRGFQTNFSGIYQQELFKNVKNMVYDKDRELYYFPTNSGEVVQATDDDRFLLGYGRWIFREFNNQDDILGRERLFVHTLFNSGDAVKMVAKLDGGSELGIINFDFDGEALDNKNGPEPSEFGSLIELPDIVNPRDPYALSLTPGFIDLVSIDASSGGPLFSLFRTHPVFYIGYAVDNSRIVWKSNLIRVGSGVSKPLDAALPINLRGIAIRGFRPRIYILQHRKEDVGHFIYRVSMTGALEGMPSE